MIPTSLRISSLETSPASILAKRARELRAEGRDVILLSSGDLDFPTSAHVREAADRAARAVPVGYTNVDGTVELKEAIRSKFARDNDLHCSLDEILVGVGSKQIMFNALMATVDPGAEVIVPAPYWASYLDLVKIVEAKPVVVPTSEASDWKLTPELLEGAITPRTRWLVINNPVNPTGCVYTKDELEALAVVLRGYPDILVMSDDLYEHVIFDRTPFATMASAAPDLAERTLTVNGVSKSYAMMGWRIGYGAGPRALIANMAKVQSQSTSNACTISQAAAVAALNGPQTEILDRQRTLGAARDLVVETVSGIPGLSIRSPEATFYAYISCHGLLASQASAGGPLQDDRDVARYLLDESGVVVLPGADCGLSPYIRINFACSGAVLHDGLRRITSCLSSLRWAD